MLYDVQKYVKSYAGKTNREVYAHAFHNLVMAPLPAGEAFSFFGNSQRKQFANCLKSLLSTLPRGAHIWDVGAGSGEILPLLEAVENATIHIEEPNQHLLKEYVESLKKYSSLSLGKVYHGPLQDFYNNPKGVADFDPNAVDLVLAIHMIYFLNDYTQDSIEPKLSLQSIMGCLYQRLKKGGRIFVVYAGPNNYAIDIALHYFNRYQTDKPYSKNLQLILEAWHDLFENHGLVGYLDEAYPDHKASMRTQHLPCHFFAQQKLDLAAMGAITYLIPSDDAPFDLQRMESCCEWVLQEGPKFGLVQEEADVPQKGCWKLSVDQVVVEITKQ
eukprot:EG_transcript_14004